MLHLRSTPYYIAFSYCTNSHTVITFWGWWFGGGTYSLLAPPQEPACAWPDHLAEDEERSTPYMDPIYYLLARTVPYIVMYIVPKGDRGVGREGTEYLTDKLLRP
jgi:hypothetical protein